MINAGMREYAELKSWQERTGVPHDSVTVASLPNPRFRVGTREFVSFGSNNYLGLASDPRLIRAAQRGLTRYGLGNCESRLLGGDVDVYRTLEAKLAALKKKDDAVLFATGYLTNLGVLSALVKPSYLAWFYGFRPTRRYRYAYFSDEANHVSIRDGIRLSEAERFMYAHVDLDNLESALKRSGADTKIIVTDGVFSMDGDIAPLPELLSLADRYDAMLYVDDAHGGGTLGKTGGGICEHFNCYSPRIIYMGTLSKAYGAIGGYIAAQRELTEILRLTSGAYGFTCPPPPDQAVALCEALDIVKRQPELRRRLWDNQAYFSQKMEAAGYHLVSKETPILPLEVGSESFGDSIDDIFRAHGFHIDVVKFPAVPKGRARIRFIMNAGHKRSEIDELVSVMQKANRRLGAGLAKAPVKADRRAFGRQIPPSRRAPAE
jgi:8-amino-7-oxononanoate synthase